MKIFLTGGSGDLGQVLTCRLQKRGDIVLRFDIRKPNDDFGVYIPGSILDITSLSKNISNIDCIVHIAAWHGYHEFTNLKTKQEFWDLNVRGTFNVFQAALENNIKNIIFISSESVSENSMYALTKRLGEEIAQHYFNNNSLNILTLRPRAFIPYWNKSVYKSFVDWAKWYWKGAVHINDVASAVIKAIDLLDRSKLEKHLILPVDGAYQYTEQDLINWDPLNPDRAFKKYYDKYYNVAIQYGLDPFQKPTQQNIASTRKWLGYIPQYSPMNLFEDLEKYGADGPPICPK